MYKVLLLEEEINNSSLINKTKEYMKESIKLTTEIKNKVIPNIDPQIKNEITNEIKKDIPIIVSKPQYLFTTFITKLTTLVIKIRNKLILSKQNTIKPVYIKIIDAFLIFMIFCVFIAIIPLSITLYLLKKYIVHTFQKPTHKINIDTSKLYIDYYPLKLNKHVSIVIIMHGFLNPLLEEISKMIAIKLKCAFIYTIIFNTVEFWSHIKKFKQIIKYDIRIVAATISMWEKDKKILETFKNIKSNLNKRINYFAIITRLKNVLMHILTTLLHKFENVYLSMLAVFIHGIWNAYFVMRPKTIIL